MFRSILLLVILSSFQSEEVFIREKGLDPSFQSQIWSDEFNIDGMPDPASWSYDLGDGCPKKCGWGNKELQYYKKASNNVFVKDGVLTIRAVREDVGNRNYSSARLITKNKVSLQYGCIEVKARLPHGVGTWPAIWLLPVNCESKKWLACGEIDIMEHVGFHPNQIYSAIHTQSFNFNLCTSKGGMLEVDNSKSEFNIYSLEWTEATITMKVNNEASLTFNKVPSATMKEWPFDQPFYLIMNITIGGGWGGMYGIEECFPQIMEIDYVRVYQ